LSIDSNPSHLAWTYAIYVTSGVQIPFPVIADRTGEISRLYGMIAPDASTQETVRNVFIIDPDQTIRAILVYPLTNGRSIPEILRLLTALQTTDKYHVVTPANWEPGQAALVPPPKTYEELLERQNDPRAQELQCEDWFWCYKQLPRPE
jgi:peroxiredoxin (alkyl hydroperoxide reductase subunit C)